MDQTSLRELQAPLEDRYRSELTERYCVIYQTLVAPPPVTIA